MPPKSLHGCIYGNLYSVLFMYSMPNSTIKSQKDTSCEDKNALCSADEYEWKWSTAKLLQCSRQVARENPWATGPGELQCILGFLNCRWVREDMTQTTAEERCRIPYCVCYIILPMKFFCPDAHTETLWFTPSCCIRPDLYSVNGSHDSSALTSESDFLWHASSGRLRRWAYRWGLVVPKTKRVIHWMFRTSISVSWLILFDECVWMWM